MSSAYVKNSIPFFIFIFFGCIFPINCIVVTWAFFNVTSKVMYIIRKNKLCSFEVNKNISKNIFFVSYISKLSKSVKKTVSGITKIVGMLYIT